MKLESCCENIEQALIAEKAGADRIEFCSFLEEDGLTPKIEEVKQLLDCINVPVRVIIRPENTFMANENILKSSVKAIQSFELLNIDGYVLGYISLDKKVDHFALKKLLEITDRPITFHKAIDEMEDIILQVKELEQYNQIDTILSSGGKKSAWEGKDTLLQMKKLSSKSILAAGGITKQNLPDLHNYLNFDWYHGTRIVND